MELWALIVGFLVSPDPYYVRIRTIEFDSAKKCHVEAERLIKSGEAVEVSKCIKTKEGI